MNAFGRVALQSTSKTKQNYIQVAWDGGSFPLRDACTPMIPAAADCRCGAEPLATLRLMHYEYEICGLACLHTDTCVSFAVWSKDASSSKKLRCVLYAQRCPADGSCEAGLESSDSVAYLAFSAYVVGKFPPIIF